MLVHVQEVVHPLEFIKVEIQVNLGIGFAFGIL